MKFPNIEDVGGYRLLLAEYGCEVLAAEDTAGSRRTSIYISKCSSGN